MARLRAAGAHVLMATSYDPNPSPLIRRTRGAAGVFAAHVWTIARRHDASVIDLWGMRAQQDLRMWAADRIHLTPAGHARVAAQALQVLGFEAAPGPAGWDLPLDPEPRRPRSQLLREDAVWLREHVIPWVGRRLLRQSSGDDRLPKRPVPGPVEPRFDGAELPNV